jgi:hypothetical protein
MNSLNSFLPLKPGITVKYGGSFNLTKQSGADGSDAIDFASLRGLGYDQTLVL